jgi:hypothetical protein
MYIGTKLCLATEGINSQHAVWNCAKCPDLHGTASMFRVTSAMVAANGECQPALIEWRQWGGKGNFLYPWDIARGHVGPVARYKVRRIIDKGISMKANVELQQFEALEASQFRYGVLVGGKVRSELVKNMLDTMWGRTAGSPFPLAVNRWMPKTSNSGKVVLMKENRVSSSGLSTTKRRAVKLDERMDPSMWKSSWRPGT